MGPYHTPVMLQESIGGLNIHAGGTYVDATFGGGGHSAEILGRLGNGRLIAFDQDEDASANLFEDERFVFVGHNFRYLKNFLHYYDATQVDGIMADLGVSSHDFDEPDRGFSFRFDGPLDMRMNRGTENTARHVVNHYSADRLASLFREYGEIANPARLASAILVARAEREIMTTRELLLAITDCIPKASEKKYLAQVFQALRMEINDEINALREFLNASLEMLKPGGRLVVITYHSIEDRLVKNFMKTGNFEGTLQKDLFGNADTPFILVNRKVIVPSVHEMGMNPRSRSAKLRIAEKVTQRNGTGKISG
jgi:16S rRNA (cytosine1402-N4)-methyltransferase